jgi:hypothetical protein
VKTNAAGRFQAQRGAVRRAHNKKILSKKRLIIAICIRSRKAGPFNGEVKLKPVAC